MAERTPVITFKKTRRNRRAFKLWDSAYLYEAMQEAVNIRSNIDKAAEVEMPPEGAIAAIPISLLYHLADAYIDAYDRLLKEELIKTANISKIQPTIN